MTTTTPALLDVLAEIFAEAGVPTGAFNVVFGPEAAGQALVGHTAVKAISFTGATAVGRAINQQAAALAYTETMDAGILHVNAPTTVSEPQMPSGGVKDSGQGGREMGRHSLAFYTELQAVSMRP